MVRRGGREAGSVWLRAHVARERVKRSGGEGESEGRRKGEQEGSPLGGRGGGGALLVLSVCWVWRRVGAWVRGWVSLGGGVSGRGQRTAAERAVLCHRHTLTHRHRFAQRRLDAVQLLVLGWLVEA